MASENSGTLEPSHAERRAWYVLLASFVAFCLIAVGLAYLSYWFVFQSTLQVPVSLVSARGIVQITSSQQSLSATTRDEAVDISPNTSIESDASSQAIATLFDPHSGAPIGSITVYRNSAISFENATAPRFGRNRANTVIAFNEPAGRIGIELFAEGSNTFVYIDSGGHRLRMDAPGRYQVSASAGNLSLAVYEGRAEWDHPTQPGIATLLSGESASVASGEGSIVRAALPENFAAPLTDGTPSSDWSFYNETQPDGIWRVDQTNTTPVLVLDRSQSRWPGITLGHGETGFVQTLNQSLEGAESLRLLASFQIVEQSLSTCGELGSECPLMIRLDYFDVQGRRTSYITGFYAAHNPALGYPLACSTCPSEHEQIRLNTWYTYDSGNLLARLPENQRPRDLISIQFYASGHAYRVFLRDLEVLVN